MGMLRDFKVAEVDMSREPMTVKQFYKDYVSQSLPVVFRNEYKDEPVVKELSSKNSQESHDDYLLSKFGASTMELMDQLSPHVKEWMEKMNKMHENVRNENHAVKSQPITYKRMRIEYGWFIKPTQTYTTEVKGTYASFQKDKKEMDSNQYVHYIQDEPLLPFPRWRFETKSLLAKILRPVNTLYT